MEAARVCRVLESSGLDCTVVPPEADAELRLGLAERWLHGVPSVSRGAVLGLPEPRDVYVAAPSEGTSLEALPSGGRIGVQGRLQTDFLGVHRPDAVALEVEGAQEALAKLDRGELEGWIAPIRVVRESGAADRIAEVLEPTSWMPGPGHGALVLEAVGAHGWAPPMLDSLDDAGARQALVAEASVVAAFGVPADARLAVTARPHGPLIRVRALVPAASGRRLVRAEVSGRLDEAEEVGRQAADQLVSRGALDLLATDREAAS